MQYDAYIEKLLEDFNLYPKSVKAVRSTRVDRDQGMTRGDSNSATFNTPKEIDLTLPTPRELKQTKKAKKKRKSNLAYLPGKNKPGI